MTDIQLLTLALAVIVPLSLLLYSNSRITDAKETLRAEIQISRADMQALRQEMRADSATLKQEVRADFLTLKMEVNTTLMRIENKLDHIVEMVASHGERLDKLEDGRANG